MSFGPEYLTVEKPFLDQLAGLGWTVVTGNIDLPSMTGRESFREVLLVPDLRAALARINRRDGAPWLDDSRILQAVSAIERIGAPRLMEANQAANELLLKGIPVEGLPDWDQGRSRTIHYIDWDRPENNTFTAVNQFRVDCPGGLVKEFVVPDITLFAASRSWWSSARARPPPSRSRARSTSSGGIPISGALPVRSKIMRATSACLTPPNLWS
jgi:type I restriction enzyme R subunit